jgi:hypothetical protein
MTRLPVLALLLALVALALGAARGVADEPPPGKPAPGDNPPDGKDAKPDEPDDGADDKIPFAEEINRALAQGVVWLKAKPSIFTMGDAEAAHWGLITGGVKYDPTQQGGSYTHPAGPTALALYTLLKCGVDPKDPVIVQGFHWLRADHTVTEQWDGQATTNGTYTWNHTQAGGSYELSVMILALTAKYDHYKRNKNSTEGAKSGKLRINNKADLDWLRELVDGLVARRGVPNAESIKPEEKQGWRYNQPTLKLTNGNSFVRTVTPALHGLQDMSSTQLAALALYSAHRFGVKADRAVWEDILTFTVAHQEAQGPERKRHDPGYDKGGYAPPVDHARGFMYIPGSPREKEGVASGSMTGCGLGTLLVAKEVLCETEKGRKEFLEKKLDKTVETAVYDGIAWLDLNWSSFTNPGDARYSIYYLYAMERAMDILGKNLIGTHLWYTDGARAILDHAKKAKVKEALKKGTREADGMYWAVGDTLEPHDVLDTCFALLFLKRATQGLVPPAPVTGAPGGPSDNR